MASEPDGGRLRPSHRRILALLGRSGPISRADLGRELGLPKATVAGLLAELVARDLVTEHAAARLGAPGRPGRMVALTGPATAIGVVSVAGSRLRSAIVTMTGEPLGRADGTLERATARPEAIAAIQDALGRAAESAGRRIGELSAVVVGVAAPVSPQRRPAGTTARRWEWIPAWLDGDLAAALGAHLGVETFVENDANLAALGELRHGAGRDRSDVMHLKVGQHSIGLGLVMDGRLVRGTAGLAGELAHVQVRPDGRVCSCGGRGCLLTTIHQELIELAQPAYDEPLNFATVLRLAEGGDIGLQRMLVDVGRAVGRPLADLCTLLNPDTIVLDGSVGPAGAHILRGLSETVERYASPAMAGAVTITLGRLGADAETLGAAALLHHEWGRTA
ncbi:ROK family transcriptional regulator [Dactylosporangium darangshiense]|uniref:ROK family transcriptional regulator n=1 Tax=Dactylosporangium darangshiense TaxID=579108 RepID=A0ABP8DDZ0_9ACTN